MQVGLLGLQMIWTTVSEVALRDARFDKRVMPATSQRFLDILNQLIDVTTQELTRIERTKFETLVTIHVHQKDIFDDLVNARFKCYYSACISWHIPIVMSTYVSLIEIIPRPDSKHFLLFDTPVFQLSAIELF